MRRYGNCTNGMHSNWASAATESVECVSCYLWMGCGFRASWRKFLALESIFYLQAYSRELKKTNFDLKN